MSATIRREGAKPMPATTARVAAELRRLKPQGPSTFVVLELSPVSYYQAAGGAGGMLVEKRTEDGRFRGFQSQPIVPFEEGASLRVGGGRVKLRRDEWFTLKQVTELLQAVVGGRGEPQWIRWREITHGLSA